MKSTLISLLIYSALSIWALTHSVSDTLGSFQIHVDESSLYSCCWRIKSVMNYFRHITPHCKFRNNQLEGSWVILGKNFPSLFSYLWSWNTLTYPISGQWDQIKYSRKSSCMPSVDRKIFFVIFVFRAIKNPNMPHFKVRSWIRIF